MLFSIFRAEARGSIVTRSDFVFSWCFAMCKIHRYLNFMSTFKLTWHLRDREIGAGKHGILLPVAHHSMMWCEWYEQASLGLYLLVGAGCLVVSDQSLQFLIQGLKTVAPYMFAAIGTWRAIGPGVFTVRRKQAVVRAGRYLCLAHRRVPLTARGNIQLVTTPICVSTPSHGTYKFELGKFIWTMVLRRRDWSLFRA